MGKDGRSQVAHAIETQTRVLGVIVVLGFVMSLFRKRTPPALHDDNHPGVFSLGPDGESIVFKPDDSSETYTGAQLADMHAKVSLIFKLTDDPPLSEGPDRLERERTLVAFHHLLGRHARMRSHIKGGSSCCN